MKFAIGMCLFIVVQSNAGDWVSYPAKPGPGAGKHVVFLSGDEEYRSEEGLPMLAKILSQRHGFKCTVLFAVDPNGTINPDNNKSVPGIEALDSADAIVMLLRFRAWPDAAMKHFCDAVDRGVPIVALRTSTHAFRFPDKVETSYRKMNDFGRNVLGENWVNHWGHNHKETTLGVIETTSKDDTILHGVGEIHADTGLYEVHPKADCKILLRGKVLDGASPTSPPAKHSMKRSNDGQQQDVNDPLIAAAWTRTNTASSGKSNRVFCTTMGAATDLKNEGLRRLVVNAVYWGLEIDVPAKADVAFVGDYQPTPYSFKGYRKGVKPADHSL